MDNMTSADPCRDVNSSGTAVEIPNRKVQEMEEKWKMLKSLNSDLQEALEKSDIEVQELTQELASLNIEKKGLQEQKTKFLDLMEEADKLKLSLEHCQNAKHMTQQGKKEWSHTYCNISGPEKRCLQMEQKEDELLYQISMSEEENRLLRDDVTRLNDHIMELERNLDAKSLELREKDKQFEETESVIEEMTVTINQYLSIKEVLNNKIKELTSQLEESQQEIAMRKASLENDLLNTAEASGTIMYEIIQNKLEKQLEKEHMEKQSKSKRGYFMLR
ncbi:uncharacterized protein [Dendropsophus ebraccatus]|uniref:uncharacterized protein n=1 Tax=Dendropsophus ebraccatus TaxID=150705 RepID=UPI003832120A